MNLQTVSRRITLPILIVFLTYFVLAVRFFKFISDTSVNILFSDHWKFYTPLFRQQGLLTLFLWQHGPPRLGLGLIMTKIVADLTGWNTRYESFAIGILIFLSSVIALALKRRLLGKLEIFDLVIPFIFLNLYQWEAIVGVPNIAVAALPLLFIILTAFLLSYADAQNSKVDIALLIINFLAIYTGFGIFLGVIVPGYFLLRARWEKAGRVRSLIFAGLAVLSLLSFFINHRQESGCLNQSADLLSYVKYISLMINAFIGVSPVSPIYLLLPLLFLTSFIYLAFVFIKTRNLNKHFPIVMLFSYAFLFAVFTSLGRICIGVYQGQSSRYMTFMIPLYFGFYLFLSLFTRPKIRALSLATLVLLFVFISTNNLSLDHQRHMTNSKRKWKECYLRYEDIERCNAFTRYRMDPNPESTVLEKLHYLKKNRLNLFLDATEERNPSEETAINTLGKDDTKPANSQGLQRAQGETNYSVDTVFHLTQPKGPVVIDSSKTAEVIIMGWAVDSKAKVEAGGVFINLDEKTDIATDYGADRPDVAVIYNNPRYRWSGFVGAIPVSLMGKGRHVLTLRILTVDRKEYYEPSQQIVLDIH